jgi:hypothetical protein
MRQVVLPTIGFSDGTGCLTPRPRGGRLLPSDKRTDTMAITIDAPPAALWPSLVQMGLGLF